MGIQKGKKYIKKKSDKWFSSREKPDEGEETLLEIRKVREDEYHELGANSPPSLSFAVGYWCNLIFWRIWLVLNYAL